MNQSRVHSSQGNVPFAWENKPGVCKSYREDGDHSVGTAMIKLRPPPCSLEKCRPSAHDSSVPPPPCTFQGPPYRSSSKKGHHHSKKEDDPFLTAYKECTKSTIGATDHLGRNRSRLMFSLMSCKRSCDVRDDNLVSKSRLPGLVSIRGRDDDDGRKWLNP